MFSRLVTIVLYMVLSGGAGYLLGSFPTAYLLVRWKSKIDIRTAGSGNVGGLNSYVVSKSRVIAVIVVLVDALKGVAAVLIAPLVAGDSFIYMASAGIGAVLGHNFPVWLRFKGGRGLATSGGVLAVFSWPLDLLWCVFWGGGYLMTRKVNIGNIIATLILLVFVLALPANMLRTIIPVDAAIAHFKYFTALLVGLVLIKHIEPLQEYVKERKLKKEEKRTDAGA